MRDLLRREFGSGVETGDRMSYGPVELIVRKASEDHEIMAVGLAVEPTRAAVPRLPLFQSGRDLLRAVRRWRDRHNPAQISRHSQSPPALDDRANDDEH